MRPASFILFIALFAARFLSAQTACPVGSPYPHVTTCAAACVLCGSLDGFSSSTAQAGVGQVIPGFCTQIVHSMKYVAFIAGSTSLSIDVSVGGCTLGNAIEMGIYDSPDCSTFNLVSNCNTQMNANTTYSFSTTEPLNPGCHYYLVFDNNGPAACPFTVTVTSGSTGSPDLPAPPLPIGPAQFCPGASVEYTIPPQNFACEYEWTAPPGATIDGLPSPATLDHDGGNSVIIKFGNTPGNVCVRAKNACKTSPWACKPVTLKVIPPTTLPPVSVCQGQGFEWLDGNIYSLPQLLSYTYQTADGCDSVVKQQLKVTAPTLTNLGPQYICGGECVTIAGLTACTQGIFDTLLMGAAGCDSLVRFGVIVIPVNAQIAPVGDSLDCQTTQIALDGHGSVGEIWKWFQVGFPFPVGSDTTKAVYSAGIYKLVLETTAFGKTCRDTAQVVVNQSVSLPTIQIFGQNITCQNPIAQLSATTQPPNATRFWTGPNGFQSTAQSPTTTVPGLYFLEITDPANGCTALDSILILENKTAPIFSVNNDTTTCLQATAMLFANAQNPNLTFQWIENQVVVGTGPSFSSQNPGSFQVVAADPANGCTAQVFAQIFENTAVPIFSVKNDTTTCSSPTVQLFANSQNPNLTFQWLDNQVVVGTGPSFSSQNPGSFQVVAADPANGCTAQVFAQVFENKSAPIFTVNKDTITCNTPTAQLFANSQNPNLAYQWLENQVVIATGESFLTQNAGNFQVVATDPANGCTATQNATAFADSGIPQLTLSAPPDTLTCLKNFTQIEVAATPNGLQFSWISVSGQGILGAADGQNLTVNQPGQFILTATNPANQCTASLSVFVFENKKLPVADAGISNLLNCIFTEVTLGNSSLNPTGLAFSWTGPAISAANSSLQSPKIDLPGTYFLTVTDLASSCTALDSIEIVQDIEPPIVTITPPEPLTCTNPQVKIHATCTAFGGFVSWQWLATNGGSIVSGSSSSSCTANLLGEYTAFAFNANNGCFDSASVFLPEFTDLPEIDAGPPQVLNCKNLTIALLGSGDAGPNFTQSWSTPSGKIISGANGFSPVVAAAGLYFFEIADTTNGCISTDYVAVTEDFTAPAVDAGPAKTLDCGSQFLNLEGSVASNIAPNWTTTGGNFLDAPTQISPKIDAPGWYFLTATDPANGCSAIDSVLVSPDSNAPVVSIAPPDFFSCKISEISLSATAAGVSPNANLTQNWTTVGGQILSGANSLTPKIGEPGSYFLTVTDQSNGCSTVVSVVVAGDFEPPVINFSSPDPLTCDVFSTTISATITTVGNDFNFEWIPAPGLTILSGQNTLMPTVGQEGNYQIVATDLSNGCADTLTVVVGRKNISQHLVAIFAPDSLDCATLNIVIDAALSFSGPGFDLTWKTTDGLIVSGEKELDPTVGAGGTYTLIIKDLGSGCLDSVSVFVVENFTKPIIQIAPPEVMTCLKTSVKLLGNGSGLGQISKKWTTLDGQFLGGTDQFSATATAPGLYSFEIKDAVNGCISRDSVEVLEDSAPPIFSIKTDSITCLNPVAKLAAIFQNPDLTFVWAELTTGTSPQPVGSSPDFETSEPGVFSIAATDPANGCTASDTVFVSKKEGITGISFDLDLPLCFDGSGASLLVAGVAGATQPISYSIDNQSFSFQNQWAGLPSGDHFLKIKDAVGCTFDTTVMVSAPLNWQVSLGPDTTIIIGEKVRLALSTDPSDVFLKEITWRPAVLIGCDTCRAQVVAPKHDRWFEIVATDQFGCTRSDSILVKVLFPEVFVPNIFSPNGDDENDLFRPFCGPGVVKIRRFAVFTRWGDAVFFEKNGQPNDPDFGWDGDFRGKKVQEGVYVWFMSVELEGGRVRRLKGDVTVAR